MQMREIQICVILSMALLVMSESKDGDILNSKDHEVKKREAFAEYKDQFSKRYSSAGLTIVNPPKHLNSYRSTEVRRRTGKDFAPPGSLRGYLQLMPISSPRSNYDSRNPKSIRTHNAQERIMNNGYSTLPDYVKPKIKSKPAQELSLGEKIAKWLFSSDEDDSEEAGTAPKEAIVRPPPGYQLKTSSYENYPPYDSGSSKNHHDSYSSGSPKNHHDSYSSGSSKNHHDSYSSGSSKNHHDSYSRPPAPPAPRNPPPKAHYQRPYNTYNTYNHNKKDCNPCNSVPWIPISKITAGHHGQVDSYGKRPVSSYGVPTVDVHHDTTGYSSSNQPSVVAPAPAPAPAQPPVSVPAQTPKPPGPAPAPVVEHSPDSTISTSYGLPVGNIPTGHGLLPPVNHLAATPSNYVGPEIQHHATQGFIQPIPTQSIAAQPIPFPQLSPMQIAPILNSHQFMKPETSDLVPPIAPQRSVSNVIFTISEQPGPSESQPLYDNHLEKGETQAATHTGSTLINIDQSSEPSSSINAYSQVNQQDFNRYQQQVNRPQNHQFIHQNQNQNQNQHQHQHHRPQHQGGHLDIVQSVPLAEYTSSIEYPLHVIQSPPYIDIATANNATSKPVTYEKEPQTGSQKVSDILLGSVDDNDAKKSQKDSDASGTIISEHNEKEGKASENIQNFVTPDEVIQTTGAEQQETTTASEGDPNVEADKASSPLFVEVRPSEPSVVPLIQSFQNSYRQENGLFVSNPIGQDPTVAANPDYNEKDWLDPNILTPPPAPPSITQLLPLHGISPFNLPSGTPTPYLNPPKLVEPSSRPTKETPHTNLRLLPSPSSTSWLLPAQSDVTPHWLLPASSAPSIPYPFSVEHQGIASVINGGLLPPPAPQPLNPKVPKTKKIQIIIPYTTINNKDYDQNTLDSIQRGIYQTLTTLPKENEPLPESALSTDQIPTQNQGRKIPPPQYQNFENFKNINWNEGHSESQAITSNTTNFDPKYYKDMKHILATNIKELLKDEVEKPKTEQNIRLQKNIDNWTALEYSNHKIVTKKEPQDVIAHAQAVTSIPGTSISHLLLPSKKIPKDYLTTTPIPFYDEPATTPFSTSGVSVESKPFTGTSKKLMTVSMYSTVARNGLFTTTPKPEIKKEEVEKRKIYKIDINKLEQIKQQNIRNSQLTDFAIQENHRNGYAEVSRTKVNNWGKFNENLVVPEEVSGRTRVEVPTTISPTWSIPKVTITGDPKEKVYVVTPVSSWGDDDEPEDGYKRTTRHVSTTEKYQTTKTPEKTTKTPEKTTKKYVRQENTFINFRNQKPLTVQNSTKINQINVTATNVTNNVTKEEAPLINFNKTQSTPLFRLKNDNVNRTKISKFNKPKPIEKFFATTTAPLKTTTGKSDANKTKPTEKSVDSDGKPSINDIFPFRNGGEIPLEMSSTNLNPTQIEFKNTAGERKTLIKQVKTVKTKEGRKITKEGISNSDSTNSLDDNKESIASSKANNLRVDVLFPHNDSSKISTSKKSPAFDDAKKFIAKTKLESSNIQRVTRKYAKEPKPTVIYPGVTKKLKNLLDNFNPDEPNITEDERERINDLSLRKNNQEKEETLVAVESKLPKGVFGETNKMSKISDSKEIANNISWVFKPETIRETIRLLKDFLRDAAEDLPSEKTDNIYKTNKDFKEHDKLLTGLESLKPMFNKTIEMKETDMKMNVKENLNNIENKLLKKFNEKGKEMKADELSSLDVVGLNKFEIDLVEGAMVELKKKSKT